MDKAIAYAAGAYYWLRVAHYLTYTAGIPFVRTLTFVGSWLVQICILYQILGS